METTNYQIEAKRLTACGEDGAAKVCGGMDVLVCACPKRRGDVSRREENVIDMEAYRRAHSEAVPPNKEPAEPGVDTHNWSRVGLALDFLATTAILLVVAGVLLKLFVF